jgi:hypothetical protein
MDTERLSQTDIEEIVSLAVLQLEVDCHERPEDIATFDRRLTQMTREAMVIGTPAEMLRLSAKHHLLTFAAKMIAGEQRFFLDTDNPATLENHRAMARRLGALEVEVGESPGTTTVIFEPPARQ